MLIDFIIQFPVANAIKMTLDGESTDRRASFDQQRFADVTHVAQLPHKYFQPFEKNDPLKLQFYTNYPQRRVRVLDESGTEKLSLDPVIARTFTGKFYRADCKFASLEGKLFIYFDEGFEYSDAAFTEPGDFVTWLGRLPQVALSEGDVLRFNIQEAGFEDSEIVAIRWNPDLKVEGLLTDKDSAFITPVDGVVEISYNEKDANLYQCEIDLSGLDDGVYYIKAEFGISSYTRTFTSEPIDVRTEHKESLAIDYSHEGLFGSDDEWEYLYIAGWYNRLRFAMNFHQITPAGQIQVYEDDDGATRQTRAVPYRELTFRAYNLPSWLVDKLNVVFAHDKKKINDYFWEVQSFGDITYIENTDFCQFEVTCRQVDSRLSYTKNFQEDLTASFDPDSFEDIDFQGDTLQATFSSNTDSVFNFVALPHWITTDHEYGFKDGDTITFIIDANATFFDRTSILRARAEDFPTLEAEIRFEQAHDDTQVEFIDASPTSVNLGPLNGDNDVVTVNASGAYDVTRLSGFSFTTSQEESGAKLRITAPSDNNDGSVRTATYRLSLQSNPSVFVDITVSQSVLAFMLTVEPGFALVDGLPNSLDVDVTVVGSAQYQAVASHSWLTVTSAVLTGNQTVSIFISKNPSQTVHRTGSVTFYNINNPNDSVTVVIEQEGQSS
ncbi:MAG: BACON domain-containing protein [Bacteroidota bacterium]